MNKFLSAGMAHSQILLPLFLTHLSGCFPRVINFPSYCSNNNIHPQILHTEDPFLDRNEIAKYWFDNRFTILLSVTPKGRRHF